MNATEAAEAVVEWAVETCPALNNPYDHDPARIQQALPTAIAGDAQEEVLRSDPTLGLEIATFGLEQTDLRAHRIEIELMASQRPTEEAARELEGFVDALAKALRADKTLGGRVEAASPYWRATYKPPFVEFDDTTVARRAVFSLVVADLVA